LLNDTFFKYLDIGITFTKRREYSIGYNT